MANFTGESFTSPFTPGGAQDGTGQRFISPFTPNGEQHGTGQRFLLPCTTYYAMTAKCSGDGLRHYWINTDANFTGAPACSGGYVAGSLVKLGSWRT